jgi:Mitochondrial carrier protein.
MISVIHFRVGGLWRGLMPNILRNSVINAVELASYDEIKYQIISRGFLNDGIGCHFVASAVPNYKFILIFLSSLVSWQLFLVLHLM